MLHFVQRDLLRGHTVNPALHLAEKLERLHRPRANPLGQRRTREDVDQFTDVAVRGVVIVVGVGMGVRGMDQLARAFLATVGEEHVDLGRTDTAPVDRAHFNPDVSEAQTLGDAPNPRFRRTGGNQRAEQHVTADPGCRVEDGKTSI